MKLYAGLALGASASRCGRGRPHDSRSGDRRYIGIGRIGLMALRYIGIGRIGLMALPSRYIFPGFALVECGLLEAVAPARANPHSGAVSFR